MSAPSPTEEKHVEWSEKDWNPISSADLKADVLPLITYICLSGKQSADQWFWKPLFDASPESVPNSYDAVAHFWFPNLKFILETTYSDKQPVSVAWVSARNVLDHDIRSSSHVLEKLILDSCSIEPAVRISSHQHKAYKSLQQMPLPDFRSHHDPKVWRGKAQIAVTLQRSAKKPGSPFAKFDSSQQALQLSKLNRNIAALTFPNIGMLCFHLLYDAGVDCDLTLSIFRLFLLINAFYNDKNARKGPMMHFQLRVGKSESVHEWVTTMVEHEKNKATFQKGGISAYKMTIKMDPLVGAGAFYPFERTMLNAYALLYGRYHSNGHSLDELPTELDVLALREGDDDARRFAMSFTNKFKASIARFGHAVMHCNFFMPLTIYENGLEVKDNGKRTTLLRSFEDYESTRYAMLHPQLMDSRNPRSPERVLSPEEEMNIFYRPPGRW